MQPNSTLPSDDLFSNIENLRISQDFETGLGVKKALLTIPVKKPSKEWWVRTHPEMGLTTGVVELKEDNELYLVHPALWDLLHTEATFGPRMMMGAMNRQNVFFIWPLRLPSPDGRTSDWARSAMEAAALAQKHWIRMTSNRSLGAYDIYQAPGDYADPEWPSEPFGELLRIAFKNYFIDSFDHPVLKQLRGEQ